MTYFLWISLVNVVSQLTLLRTNRFEEYDARKFKEQFRLSKTTLLHLLTEVTAE